MTVQEKITARNRVLGFLFFKLKVIFERQFYRDCLTKYRGIPTPLKIVSLLDA
jgi:hypothetical protein